MMRFCMFLLLAGGLGGFCRRQVEVRYCVYVRMQFYEICALEHSTFLIMM